MSRFVIRSSWLALPPSLRARKAKIKEETIQLRKERQRLKLTNLFSQEYTGERPFHAWLDSRKLKLLGKLYENMRNNNRMFQKIDAKEKKHFVEKFPKINEFQYREVLEENILKKQFEKNFKNCEKEIETLPFELKTDIQKFKDSEKAIKLLDDVNIPYDLFFEQILRIYPIEHGLRMKFLYRFGKIIEDDMEQKE